MTKTTLFPFIFHAGITVSLTCSHYSRYPVCALEKDSAGRGNPLLHKGASRCHSGFILRESFYGRDLREPFGVAGFPLCAGFPPRKLLPAQPWKADRQAFNLHRGGNHA